MNLLRATVRNKGGWWEIRLLDLNIVADGDSEQAMLRDLEFSLTAEYRLALKYNKTPFVSLYNKDCPEEVSKAWEDGGKNLRTLNLPDDVRQALSAVFRRPDIAQFAVKTGGAKAA